MAIVPMSKIRVLTTRDHILQVTGLLQSLSVMEITEFKGKKTVVEEFMQKQAKSQKTIDFHLAQITFLENFLSQNAPDNLISPKTITISENKSYQIQHYFDWNLVEKAQNIRDELLQIDAKTKSLHEEKSLITPWQNFDQPLHALTDTDFTTVRFGKFPKTNHEPFIQQLTLKIPDSHFISAQTSPTEIFAMILTHKNHTSDLDSLLSQFQFSQITLPKRRGTPKAEIDRIQRRLLKLEAQTKTLKSKAADLAIAHLNSVRVLTDELTNKKIRHDEAQKFGHTQTVNVITGWIPTSHISPLKKKIRKVAPASFIHTIKPKKSDIPPVTLKNNALGEAAEAVTEVYGMPLYSEIDPTPWLAGFFIIFFGFCLTDAGYGLSLMLLSGSALFFMKNKLTPGVSKMVKLMFLAGISTTILGAIFGGWFGIDFAILPLWAQNLTLINPLNNPMLVLGISLALGFIHLWVGYLAKFVHLLKQHDLKSAFMEQLPWLIFWLAGAFWIASNPGNLLPQFAELSKFIMWGSTALLILGTGFKNTLNPLKAILVGASSLWGIVGFVSDILSYSRLLALGLATGIIAMVINLIAGLAIEMIGPAGWILAILILIGGHIFNLAINVLGAFIHSSRLQFVEFFSKFMEGGGRPFAPFKKSNKWIIYEKN